MSSGSMNTHIINWFHQKRKNHGLVYVSNDRMGYALRFELSPRLWDQQVDGVSETEVLVGPVECDGDIYFRAKLTFAKANLEALFSLGRPSGPVICWECRQVETVMESVPALFVASY